MSRAGLFPHLSTAGLSSHAMEELSALSLHLFSLSLLLLSPTYISLSLNFSLLLIFFLSLSPVCFLSNFLNSPFSFLSYILCHFKQPSSWRLRVLLKGPAGPAWWTWDSNSQPHCDGALNLYYINNCPYERVVAIATITYYFKKLTVLRYKMMTSTNTQAPKPYYLIKAYLISYWVVFLTL